MTNEEHRKAGHMFDYNKRQWVDKSGNPAMYDGPSSFKAVASKIAKKQGISKERASAILASSTRKASDEAKRKNPKLKRVKGKPKK